MMRFLDIQNQNNNSSPGALNSMLAKRYREAAPTNQASEGSKASTMANSSSSAAPNTEKKTVKKRENASKKESYIVPRPNIRLNDLAGLSKRVYQDIKEWIERPLFQSKMYQHIGMDPPHGVLICGPSGCGKTSLALAVAGEYGFAFIKISATEIISGMSGESESKLRDIFEEAKRSVPCILFIDDIDAIIVKKELAQREMEKRIVSQLCACMDDLNQYDPLSTSESPVSNIIVLAATSRPESLDTSLRRPGRFDHELNMGIPDEYSRECILELFIKKLRVDHTVQVKHLARNTPGYTGADLKMLTREAAMHAIQRILNEKENSGESTDISNDINSPSILSDAFVSQSDFASALERVQPSAKREGFAVVPDVTWSDIGALKQVRQELRLAVVEPLRQPELYASVGLIQPAGVLLWGPPGCGKTLLAKAVANQTHSNFISIKGPELLNKYVGESERAVRQVFERARLSSPCVIFFDELDALCPRRNEDGDSNYSSRIVNQLLTEMDGLESRQQVYILGATNRPDIIDPAMLRPGRLDKLIYVRLPDADERWDILLHQTRKTPLAPSVDLMKLAHDPRTDGFSGADLAALVREASLCAIQDHLLSENDSEAIYSTSNQHASTSYPVNILVEAKDFELAFSKIRPSVSESSRKTYESIHKGFCVGIDSNINHMSVE
jgi:ribosome biogenesis ATPase